MSDNSVIKYTNTGLRFAYPNTHSFDANRNGAGRVQLQRGTIWSMKPRQVSTTYGDYDPTTSWLTRESTHVINEQVYKRFQYNPAEISMRMNAVATDPAQSQNPDGNLYAVAQGMGALSMEMELMFTRDQEVYAATMGMQIPEVTTNAQDMAVFARVGVQKDIYDLYRVMMAAGTNTTDSSNAADQTQTLPDDVTVSGLTKKAFDLATAGSFLLQMPVAIQTSKDAIFYGFITSLSVVYNKFNFNMVPTWAKVRIGLDVTNVRPSSAAPSTVFNGDLANTPNSGGLGTNSPAQPGVQPSWSAYSVGREKM